MMSNYKHSKLDEKYKRREERKLLLKIQELPIELITIIYRYLPENVKSLYNVKYIYLEETVKIKDDSKTGFTFRNFLQNLFEPIENNKLLIFIYSIIVPFYPSIINNIWYTSIENNKLFKGLELLNLWKKDGIDIRYYQESRIIFYNIMKYRFVDAIYFYIFRNVNKYELLKIKYFKSIYYNDKVINNNFINVNKIHYLYKCLIALENKK
jgi:hypothetical protein